MPPNDPYANLVYDPRYSQVRDPYQRENEAVRIIEELKAKVIEQNQVLQALASPPFVRGTVLGYGTGEGGNQDTILLAIEGRTVEVAKPVKFQPMIGDVCRLNSKTMGIVSVTSKPEIPLGITLNIVEVLSPEKAIVEQGGNPKVVESGFAVEKGDRVIVNDSVTHVLRNLGKNREDFKTDVEKITTTWDSIGGQKLAKTEMQEAIEGPVTNRKIFEAYGKKPIKGVLLYGPPGCGKTLLAKAAAASLATLYGKNSSTGFIYVKGPEILNRYVGQSEETIRSLFSRARDHYRREGYPAVLFIDEADAILGARGGTNTMVSGMEKTIVPMFLAEMDGLDEYGPLVLLATNRSDSLDPAVVRDGRVDRKIEVTRPTEEDAREIFRMYLRGKPLADGVMVVRYAWDFAEAMYKSVLKGRACGALISGLVEMAISLAMRRDIASGAETPSGLTKEDIAASIKAVELQNLKVL